MKEYVRCLEQAVIGTCSDFGLTAHTTKDTGVWIGDLKLCALGEESTMKCFKYTTIVWIFSQGANFTIFTNTTYIAKINAI